MFKLFELGIGTIAIVKANEDVSKMPMKIHGIIRVLEVEREGFIPTVAKNMMSKELVESGDIEFLKMEAVHMTEEAVADEYPE